MKNLANYKEFIFNAENQQELRNYYKQNTRIQQEIEREKYFRSLIKLNELLSIKSESLDFTDECAKAFKEISQSDLLKLQERLKKEIKAIKDMAIYQPPIFTTTETASSGIYIYQEENIDVMLFVLDKFNLIKHKSSKGEKGITIQSNDLEILCVSGSGKFKKYSLKEHFNDGDGPPLLFDGDVEEGEYSEGTVISIRKGRDGVTFSECKQASSFISITNKSHPMLVKPQYSVDSLKIIGTVHSEPLASRLQMASITMRMLGVENTIGMLVYLLKHDNLYVRWHIAREIFLTDAALAKPIFKNLMEDPSSQLKEAAEKCLKEFYGE